MGLFISLMLIRTIWLCRSQCRITLQNVIFQNHHKKIINFIFYTHPSIFCGTHPRHCCREPGAYPRGVWAQGGGHPGSHTHSFTHYDLFRNANRPTMHVFWLREESVIPGGNPWSRENMQTQHTQGGGRNQSPNCSVEGNCTSHQATMPPC